MIDLPEYPSPNAAEAGLIDFGAFLQPPLGGPLQRIDRMGNRFKLSVSLPPMVSATDGRRWVSRLIRGKTEGVRMPYPLLGFHPGSPGEPVVHTAGQTGRVLIIRAAQPNYIFREGQPFSIETGGRHHLVFVDGETIVPDVGIVSVPISPMLRVAHLDGDPVHVGKPMIEGFIMGDQQLWSMSVEHHIGLSFDLVEAA